MPVLGMPYWHVFMSITAMLAGRGVSEGHVNLMCVLVVLRDYLSRVRGVSVGPSETEARWFKEILTDAGMKSDSTWSVKELVKLPGRMWNRMDRRMRLVTKRMRLRMKKKRPMPRIQGVSHLTSLGDQQADVVK